LKRLFIIIFYFTIVAEAGQANFDFVNNPGGFALPTFSREEAQRIFEMVRDDRSLRSSAEPHVPRRNTFLYPRDGCYFRAAQMNRVVQSAGIPPLPKMFVIGTLEIESPYVVGGRHRWERPEGGWHVALSMLIQGDIYILDPALDFDGPLKLEEWLERMNTAKEKVKLQICHPLTYSRADSCVDNLGFEERYFFQEHKDALMDLEKKNLITLGIESSWLSAATPIWSADSCESILK
jgi:hypothetical protein